MYGVNDMNSLQIKCFLEGAGCLNFTKAAANLYITQPAFSRNISLLEEELGFELFLRSDKRKSTRLSPAGAVMYEGLINLTMSWKELVEKAANADKGKNGKLVIGLLEAERIDDVFLDTMALFRSTFPDMNVVFKTGSYPELNEWLQDGVIDMALTLSFDVMDKDWICYDVLYNQETALAIPARHPLAQENREFTFLDFKDDVFIGFSADVSPGVKNLLVDECQKVGFVPKVIEVPDIRTQILYVETQQGVAVVNRLLVENNKRIKPIQIKELMPVTVVLAWNKDNYNPAISHFYSFYIKQEELAANHVNQT